MTMFKISLTPYLIKILLRLSRMGHCSMEDAIRLSIFVAGSCYDCLPVKEDDDK